MHLLGFAPLAANLFVGGKNSKEGGGGIDRNAQYKPLLNWELCCEGKYDSEGGGSDEDDDRRKEYKRDGDR